MTAAELGSMRHDMERVKAEGRPDNSNLKTKTCLYIPALRTPFLRGTGEERAMLTKTTESEYSATDIGDTVLL